MAARADAAVRRGGPVRTLVGAVLVLLVLLLLLLIGAALLVQSRLDEAALSQRIGREVLRQTGRRLTMGGLHVRLLPVPTLEASQVAFENWPGGGRPDMLTAGGLQAHVALLPLLRHVVRLEGVTLSQPDILLERNTDGQANWQLHKPVRPDDGTGSAPTGGARWQLQVGSVRLLDGRVALQDRMRNWSGAADGIRFDGSGLAGDGPAATLSGRHGTALFSADIRTGALARLNGADPSTTPWPLRVTARQQDGNGHELARVVLNGTLADPVRGRGYALDVTAQASRLDGLNMLFPHAQLPPVEGLSIRTRVTDAAPATAPHGTPQLGFLNLRTGPFQADAIRRSPWLAGLSVRSLSLDAVDRAAPLAVTLDGQWRNQPVGLHGTAGTLAAWEPGTTGANGGPVAVALDLAVGDARAHVGGSAGRDASDLRFNLAAPSLHRIVAAGPELTGLVATGQARTAGQTSVTLSDLRLESHELGLSGSATWRGPGRPTVTAVIDATHADLDALRSSWERFPDAPSTPASADASVPNPVPPAAAPVQPTAPAPLAGTGPATPSVPASAAGGAGPGSSSPDAANSSAIPFAVLQRADLDLRLDAADLRFGGEAYHALKTQLTVQDGRLSLAPFTVAGPAGPIAGQLQADAATTHVSLSLQPSMIRAETLASLFGLSPAASGTVELVADLQGSGRTTGALLAGLDGRLGASMVNGSIANAALTRLIGQRVGQSPDGRTELRCLALPAQLSNGVAHIAPLALQSRTLEVQGHGTVRLQDGGLDLHLLPRLSIGLAGASLPVHVGGTVDAPQAALDPAAPGGRFALTIGPGGPAPDVCGPALRAARFGAAGPDPGPDTAPARTHKAPKPIDILRGLGLFR